MTAEELRDLVAETSRVAAENSRAVGEIGNALGLYTESMFQPSLKRILRERFGMTVIIAPQSGLRGLSSGS